VSAVDVPLVRFDASENRRRYGGYDSPDWGHGVRDFVFSADNVTGGVDTWVRLEDGTRRAIVRLDTNFK
jgi:hypothetical protein